MDVELEPLRRRLYAPGATRDDVAAYEDAVAALPPPPLPPRARLRRTVGRRTRLIALAGAVAVLAFGAAVAGAGAARQPQTSTTPRPTVTVVATARGLTGRADVQRLINQVFAYPGSNISSVAESLLASVVQRELVPASTADTAVIGETGGVVASPVVLELPSGGLRVTAGQAVILTVAMREPATATWRIVGLWEGERGRPHTIVEVGSESGGVDRLAVAAFRLPSSATITDAAVRVSTSTPFSHRLEVHDAAVCRPPRGDGCALLR